MYDVNNDGYISQDELLSLLSMMVGSNISPEQVFVSVFCCFVIDNEVISHCDFNHYATVAHFKYNANKTKIELKEWTKLATHTFFSTC